MFVVPADNSPDDSDSTHVVEPHRDLGQLAVTGDARLVIGPTKLGELASTPQRPVNSDRAQRPVRGYQHIQVLAVEAVSEQVGFLAVMGQQLKDRSAVEHRRTFRCRWTRAQGQNTRWGSIDQAGHSRGPADDLRGVSRDPAASLAVDIDKPASRGPVCASRSCGDCIEERQHSTAWSRRDPQNSYSSRLFQDPA